MKGMEELGLRSVVHPFSLSHSPFFVNSITIDSIGTTIIKSSSTTITTITTPIICQVNSSNLRVAFGINRLMPNAFWELKFAFGITRVMPNAFREPQVYIWHYYTNAKCIPGASEWHLVLI